MKNWLFPLLLLLGYSLAAQQPAYQPFEVDSVAEPHGGMPYLTTFLQVNARKPISLEAKGLGGRVVVSGIIEPDGQVSDVKVVQPLHPDLDQEAVRVFSQFHAWKPARKSGKAVRQILTTFVTFKPNAPFRYANGIRTDYYGEDRKPISDSIGAFYKKNTPMNERGLPTGDVIAYERNRSGWKEYNRLPFVRRKSLERGPAGQPLYVIGHQNADKLWAGFVYRVDLGGVCFDRTYYEDGKSTGDEIKYHPNGLIAQKTDKYETRHLTTTWYANGQVRQIISVEKPKALTPATPALVSVVWDSTGHQLVKAGNGWAIYSERMQSFRDTAQYTQNREQGRFENGLKQGIWTGRYADGSYFYEERYDKGVCQGGKAITAGSDTVRYATQEQQPEFPGGLQGLSQFLSQNLTYPPDAQQAGIQGKVFVSFVVCTDGTLCDYEVLKGVAPAVDREALRVVKAMSGKWKPGVQRGRKVRVKYNLPINFALQ